MKHTEETRKKMSEKRKEWLKANPDKHVWKRHSKFKSVPCEKVKQFLSESGIRFLPEFTPLLDRAFAVDIAFPEKMVCIEINGNQHYDAAGKLKPYYQEKHDLITGAGWKVIEIHYSLCYNQEYISSLMSTIKNVTPLNDFDYDVWESGGSTGIRNRNNALEERCDIQFHHRPLDKFQYDVYIPINKKKEKKKCEDCGREVSYYKSKRCSSCAAKQQPKVKLPEKDELQRMIYELPMTKLSKQFGLSDVGLKKRCVRMGITIPDKSYRLKEYFKKK